MNPCLIAVVLVIVDSGQIPVVVECVDVLLAYASHLPHHTSSTWCSGVVHLLCLSTQKQWLAAKS